MSAIIAAGAILTHESPLMERLLGLQSQPCAGDWSLFEALDGFALHRKIHAAGWNCFFIAAEGKSDDSGYS
jgi:hypothetical protein